MMIRTFNLPGTLLLVSVFFNLLYAQNISGIVKSHTDQLVEGVEVAIENKSVAKTDHQGVFILPATVKLPVTLTFKHPKYESAAQEFSFTGQVFYLQDASKVEALQQVVILAPVEVKNTLIVPSNHITAQTLEEQSPIALVDAMNKIPGVYIQSGAINTNRLTIRGVGARTLYGTNKIKAYFNGIPITNGIGETVLDVYDIEDLQTVEIIKGPKASIYGTNLGGALLLNSKAPQNEGFFFQNRTTLGSFGLFKNSLATEFSDAHFSLHFNYNHMEMDGFRQNSQYRINAYVLNATYRFNEDTELSVLLNHSNYFAQLPSSIGKTDFIENPSKAASTWLDAKGYKMDKQILGGIHLKHRFSDTFENKTAVFYSYSDHYEPRPFNVLDELLNGIGVRSVFSKTFNVLDREGTWQFGTELFQDKYRWKTIENLYLTNNGNGTLEGELLSKNKEKRNYANLFADLTLPLWDKWIFQLGVNVNKTSYDYKDEFNPQDLNTSASRHFKAIVAPSLNVSYQLNQQQHLFANVSRGFNFPSLEEALTPEGVVNPEISPEKGINYEIGTEAYFFNRRWHILATGYILDITDLLVAQRVGDDEYIGRNAGRTLHKGIELLTEYKWSLAHNIHLLPYMNASFNWHEFKDFVDDGVDFSGNDLTGTPKMMFNLGLALGIDKFTLYGNHAYIGKIPMNDSNSLYSDAYHVLNIKLDYTAQLFKTLEFKLNVGVNNVTDTKYASSILINATGFGNVEPRYYYPGNPRNYYGGMMLRYHF